MPYFAFSVKGDLFRKAKIQCLGLLGHSFCGELIRKSRLAREGKGGEARGVFGKSQDGLGQFMVVIDGEHHTVLPEARHKWVAAAIADHGNSARRHAFGEGKGGGFGKLRAVDVQVKHMHKAGDIRAEAEKAHDANQSKVSGKRFQFCFARTTSDNKKADVGVLQGADSRRPQKDLLALSFGKAGDHTYGKNALFDSQFCPKDGFFPGGKRCGGDTSVVDHGNATGIASPLDQYVPNVVGGGDGVMVRKGVCPSPCKVCGREGSFLSAIGTMARTDDDGDAAKGGGEAPVKSSMGMDDMRVLTANVSGYLGDGRKIQGAVGAVADLHNEDIQLCNARRQRTSLWEDHGAIKFLAVDAGKQIEQMRACTAHIGIADDVYDFFHEALLYNKMWGAVCNHTHSEDFVAARKVHRNAYFRI